MHTFKSIYNSDITLEDVEKEQTTLRDLGRINQGDAKDKSLEQKKTTDNIRIFMTQEK